MSHIMISDVPGVDASVLDGLRAAGIPEAMARSAGFVSHVSGATPTGYRVVEVWESKADHQAWYDAHVAPTLPPGVEPITPEYTEVLLAVSPEASVGDPATRAATMRRAYDLINRGDIEGFGDLVAEDFVEHQEAPGLPPTKQGVLELFRGYRAAFPDMHMEALEVLADGDRTVARVVVSGTQTGDFMGIPGSGRRAEVQLIDIMAFDEAGLISEHWGVVDMLGMLQQLGVVPEVAPAS